MVSFQGRQFRISKAFKGQPIALRPSAVDGVFTVRFGANTIAHIDFRKAPAETRAACGFDGYRWRDTHNPTGTTTAKQD